MAQISFMSLHQEDFQDIQDFRDQYMALQKVTKAQGLRFGWSMDDMKAVLGAGLTNPNNE